MKIVRCEDCGDAIYQKIITITFRELSEGIDYWLIILYWDSFRISHGIAIQTVSTFHTRMDENHRIIVSWLWLENRARLDLEKFRTALDSSAAMSPGETRHFLFTLISARFDLRVVKTISFHSLMSFCTLIREIDWSKLHFHLKLDPIVKLLSNFSLSSFSCDITLWLGGVVFYRHFSSSNWSFRSINHIDEAFNGEKNGHLRARKTYSKLHFGR